ncbi:hypothetical protein QBC34DRAFT_386675 [Podospora aff. communis PSN243]|uniref:Uncharacterized protein n=1 Tax=Podospora aff. communis PSN243 TaxID=3040156 RepID=A0AAV9G4M7_9PEZI|nr:hypothetical protein QBC34DRAFT_386675 [Podospora aff. communis PSN243]
MRQDESKDLGLGDAESTTELVFLDITRIGEHWFRQLIARTGGRNVPDGARGKVFLPCEIWLDLIDLVQDKRRRLTYYSLIQMWWTASPHNSNSPRLVRCAPAEWHDYSNANYVHPVTGQGVDWPGLMSGLQEVINNPDCHLKFYINPFSKSTNITKIGGPDINESMLRIAQSQAPVPSFISRLRKPSRNVRPESVRHELVYAHCTWMPILSIASCITSSGCVPTVISWS